MSYYTKVLLPDEQVRHVGQIHWVIYLRGWIWFALAIIAAIAAWRLGVDASQTGQPSEVTVDYALGAAALMFLFGLLTLIGAWLRKATTEIVVTDRRIIYKEGFIRRRTLEMNMNKVETVDVVQSIWARVLNYGTIVIRGVGSSYEPLRLIARPLQLRTAIVAQ